MEAPTWTCVDEGPHLHRLRYEAHLNRADEASQNAHLSMRIVIVALAVTFCLLAQWAVVL